MSIKAEYKYTISFSNSTPNIHPKRNAYRCPLKNRFKTVYDYSVRKSSKLKTPPVEWINNSWYILKIE